LLIGWLLGYSGYKPWWATDWATEANGEGYYPETADNTFNDEHEASYIKGIESAINVNREELITLKERVRELEFQLNVKSYTPSKGESAADAQSIKDKLAKEIVKDAGDVSEKQVVDLADAVVSGVINQMDEASPTFAKANKMQKARLYKAVAVQFSYRAKEIERTRELELETEYREQRAKKAK
jgi:hypothetical protein